jgi:hypothetical protein
LPAAPPYFAPCTAGRGLVSGGGCYASVLLDGELWQSLSTINGRDVSWVHGCVLDHGHDDDHGAPAYRVEGEPQHWLRWSDTGPARLDRVELSPPATNRCKRADSIVRASLGSSRENSMKRIVPLRVSRMISKVHLSPQDIQSVRLGSRTARA